MFTLLSSLILLAGCTTGTPLVNYPLVNWDRRVGNYSYNLALVDLGTPERSATLPNGTLVADWITRRSTPGTMGLGTRAGFEPPTFWESSVPGRMQPTPNYHLRLTFGRDGKLTAWEKYSSFSQ
ncbi:MAG: hypothetical protein JWR69_1673 [Pedosphaera sp.]|nr:hypothetical protein [Pedosphaera sp.]